MGSLYRFISFEQLIDVVQKKSLTFVLPSLWEDPYEGYIVKTLRMENGLVRIKAILDKLQIQEETKNLLLCLFHKSHLWFYGQSWTRNPESDALWRIYNHNNFAVRIQISDESVKLLNKIETYDVTYVDFINLEDEIKNIPTEMDNGIIKTDLHKIYQTKRKAFSHEEEVRLISRQPENLNLTTSPYELAQKNQFIEMLYQHKQISQAEYLRSRKEQLSKISPVKYISFQKIPKFIQSVMLHPLAPDWFNETLKEFCLRNKLKYLGKSRLYTLS